MLGPLLAVGRTSEVFAFGDDAVAKVLAEHVPRHWASVEAHTTDAVRSLGLPVSAVREIVTIRDRPAVIFDRVVGPSMWQQMVAAPGDIDAIIADMAAVQRMIHAAGIPTALPSLVERMSSKIAEVDSLDSVERVEAERLVRSMPCGAALLHGDLHPGNILLGADGPVVIDWFDASVGHPAADVVRSSLLMRPSGATDLRHLPDSTPELVASLHDAYLDAMSDVIDPVSTEWSQWEAVTAASRLAERTDADTAGLHALWTARPEQPTRSR